MNNFIKRALSGIAFVAVFIFALWGGETSFCCLFATITSWSLYEFSHLLKTHQIANLNENLNIYTGIYLFFAFFLFMFKGFSVTIFMPYIFSLVFIMVSEIFQKKENPLAAWAYTFAAQLYIALPFSLLNTISIQNQEYNFIIPLSIFIFIWLNDTGAYLVGSLLHNKIPYKLSPTISPNKTWVGSIGGFLIVLLVGIALHAITGISNVWLWMGLGLTVAIFGTFGDLVESMLKRQLGVKDSGNFLPGHGGILDRFDSALFAIPMATVYIYCTNFLM